MPCLHYLHGFKRSPLARRELENRGEVTNQLVIVKVLWRCDVGFFLLVPFFLFSQSTLSQAGGVGGTLRLPARDSPFFFLPSLFFHLSSSLAGGVGGTLRLPARDSPLFSLPSLFFYLCSSLAGGVGASFSFLQMQIKRNTQDTNSHTK